jgi:hypothetical protein
MIVRVGQGVQGRSRMTASGHERLGGPSCRSGNVRNAPSATVVPKKAAYGDMNRSTNQFYPQLRNILSLQPDGHVYLNRSLADWPRHWFRKPYTRELVRILGAPISPREMWNPDAGSPWPTVAHRERRNACRRRGRSGIRRQRPRRARPQLPGRVSRARPSPPAEPGWRRRAACGSSARRCTR